MASSLTSPASEPIHKKILEVLTRGMPFADDAAVAIHTQEKPSLCSTVLLDMYGIRTGHQSDEHKRPGVGRGKADHHHIRDYAIHDISHFT